MPTSPWVLDLTSNPPNIFNEDGTENLHNAFESPYPVCFWYVSTNPNDVTHMGALEYHTPAFTQPYPSVFWYVNDSEDDVSHNGAVVSENLGAFLNASNLISVQFPTTLERLGPNVATNTSLTSVTIPSTCTYDTDSTFPTDCTVNFFPNS